MMHGDRESYRGASRGSPGTVWGRLTAPARTASRALTESRAWSLRSLIAIVTAAFLAACPPREDPPDDPPDDPPGEALLMDSVPRVDRDLLIYSRAGLPGGESSVDTGAPPPDPPNGEREDGQPEEPGAEMEDFEVEDPPIFSRGDVRYADGAPPRREWRELRFASGAYQPGAGVDSALAAAIPGLISQGREMVYGFLLTEEYLAGPRYQQLDRLGVEVLGAHGGAYKVAIPLDPPETVEDAAELDFVHWIGFGPPELRISPELEQLREELDRVEDAPAEVPLYINLFDAERAPPLLNALDEARIDLGDVDEDLHAVRAMAAWEAVDGLVAQDFVLYAEPMLEQHVGSAPLAKHDESTPTIGADYIRPNYDGAPITLGILDTGFMVGSAAATMHQDLNKWGLGVNFTNDAAGVWNDEHGHGTHVLGTIAGTGAADSRYRGVAPGIGSSANQRIRAAKIFNANGSGATAWIQDGMDWLTNQGAQVINYSGGGYNGQALAGTDSTSRKLDANVWNSRPLYVVCAGNDGPGASTNWRPAVAKNALSVGNVRDYGFDTVGRVWTSSSRGPTADGRMKPNVVAPGRWIGSPDAGTTSGYRDSSGTSMAAPHAAGLAATMMEHYSSFQDRPMLTRARLMATALLHDDDVTLSDGNDYGLGRVSSYKAHWRRDNPNGWRGHWSWGQVHEHNYLYRDIEVPENAHRLVVVMTWDEPPASAGADAARLWDLELWLEHNPGLALADPWDGLQNVDRRSWSWDDNVLTAIVDRPAAGTWRMLTVPYDAPHAFWNGYSLPVGMAATVIRGDTQPDMTLTASSPSGALSVGDTFEVQTTVSSSSYVLSGVHLENTVLPAGMQLEEVRTTRADGVEMSFGSARELTLGNVVQGRSRTVTWRFRITQDGCRDIEFRAWSDNGGTEFETFRACAGGLDIILDPIFGGPA